MKASDVKPAAKPKAKRTGEHKGGYHRRSLDVRIHELDIQIAGVLRLLSQREDIVKRDRETLAKHQASWLATKEKMEALSAKRDRLVQERDHPLSKEEKEQLRAQRKQEEEKVSLLLQALNQSGKSLDDLLDELSSKTNKENDHE